MNNMHNALTTLQHELKRKSDLADSEIIQSLILESNDANSAIQTSILPALYRQINLKNAGAVELWNTLLDRNINTRAKNKTTGNTVLMELVAYGYICQELITALELFIKQCPDSVNEKNNELTTPLMLASQHGAIPTVTLLLKYGARKEDKNQLGQTAEDIAVSAQAKSEDTTSIEAYKTITAMLRH